jgi:hypothetical protein
MRSTVKLFFNFLYGLIKKLCKGKLWRPLKSFGFSTAPTCKFAVRLSYVELFFAIAERTGKNVRLRALFVGKASVLDKTS